MNMACARLARWVLARAEASGAHEALVGDLLEELADGRSAAWMWRQLIGWCAVSFAQEMRQRLHPSPLLVSLALATLLAGGMSLTSPGSVVQTWMVLYVGAGALSLFAHVTARTAAGRTLCIPAGTGDAEHG
jgi:hypothetical protein